jgi:hypothetical protein
MKNITIIITNFAHDINGNPTAQFSAIKENGTDLIKTKRRRQISYTGTNMAQIQLACMYAKICFGDYDVAEIKGSRSEGSIIAILTLKV